ncbi:hypothetical protein COT75_04445 [Candidatus Beckwithbacteria bacterium CG10_big_fil_rev_8_21_14_0_10_34_10]|uniref:Uncharacterized protein n=1 Tax=Candidatus Beckwithbacteria bacterium CG10_big_fil_rev_8_21_14_0_10_34_10 TaxID=1974495 RepID=A0A2H0W8E9_9BACT|nr:MAG: hypothetical protein COT75_04445 [Candidatus Beckwithbacteria bacterium CG10_big_fil_rev_8_21_14_0_10_34_10]
MKNNINQSIFLKIKNIYKVFLINFLILKSLSLPTLAFAKELPLGQIKGIPGGYDPGTDIESASQSLTDIFSNVFGVMTIIGGLMFILYFVIGGISWITSGGDKEKVEKAKNKMTNAAVGIIVVIASYSIAFIIGKILGIDILDPSKYLAGEASKKGVLGPGKLE